MGNTKAIGGGGANGRRTGENADGGSRMQEMRFGIRGTKRPCTRDDEGDPIGIVEGDR
jgi:hypothetical protein